MVEVHIFLPLWPADMRDQELDLGGRQVRVHELIASLGLNPDEVGIVTIDGRQCEDDAVVPQTCRLCIFGLLSGG